MSIVARGLARGLAAGFIVAVGLGLGSTPVEPPITPEPPTASLYAPGAIAPARRDGRLEDAEKIKRQNDTILAVVMAAVNSRLLE